MPLITRVPRILRVGTDFSGLDMPAFALPFVLDNPSKIRHVFACDASPSCRQFVALVHKPQKIYADITDRDVTSVPACDLYMWGPPCQSFSTAGLCEGANDPRGQLPKYSLKYIKVHRPRLTIMETWTVYKRYTPYILCSYLVSLYLALISLPK